MQLILLRCALVRALHCAAWRRGMRAVEKRSVDAAIKALVHINNVWVIVRDNCEPEEHHTAVITATLKEANALVTSLDPDQGGASSNGTRSAGDNTKGAGPDDVTDATPAPPTDTQEPDELDELKEPYEGEAGVGTDGKEKVDDAFLKQWEDTLFDAVGNAYDAGQ